MKNKHNKFVYECMVLFVVVFLACTFLYNYWATEYLSEENTQLQVGTIENIRLVRDQGNRIKGRSYTLYFEFEQQTYFILYSGNEYDYFSDYVQQLLCKPSVEVEIRISERSVNNNGAIQVHDMRSGSTVYYDISYSNSDVPFTRSFSLVLGIIMMMCFLGRVHRLVSQCLSRKPGR